MNNLTPEYNYMYMDKFQSFLESPDTLHVYSDDSLVFSSNKDRLLPLVECIKNFKEDGPVVLFDKIVGNAAALLAVRLGCDELYSPLGSQLAIKTLLKYGIKYHFLQVVTFIQNESKQEMCPMERLSIGKGPEEFYNLLYNRMHNQDG
jgi:hypothetical protein